MSVTGGGGGGGGAKIFWGFFVLEVFLWIFYVETFCQGVFRRG